MDINNSTETCAAEKLELFQKVKALSAVQLTQFTRLLIRVRNNDPKGIKLMAAFKRGEISAEQLLQLAGGR